MRLEAGMMPLVFNVLAYAACPPSRIMQQMGVRAVVPSCAAGKIKRAWHATYATLMVPLVLERLCRS